MATDTVPSLIGYWILRGSVVETVIGVVPRLAEYAAYGEAVVVRVSGGNAAFVVTKEIIVVPGRVHGNGTRETAPGGIEIADLIIRPMPADEIPFVLRRDIAVQQ